MRLSWKDHKYDIMTRDQANEMLKASITQFIQLTDEECCAISRFFYTRKLEKKEHFISYGQTCSEIAFIATGCIRIYYKRDNADRTGQFFFENSWYADYESWVTRQPATLSAQALEPTELLLISFNDLERLYNEHPKFERMGRLMAEHTIMRIRNRSLSLLNNSPEERYLNLIKERPIVIERVPQHIIASYLAIEPETLSRIRKKISLKRELI